MNRLLLPFLLLLSWSFSCSSFAQPEGASPTEQDLTSYINPLIGTAQATTARVLGHNTETYAQVIPGVGVPHGMTQWTPQSRTSEEKCLAPYYHTDSLLSGFRGTHWLNGSCVQDYGSLTLMPFTGEPGFLPAERASAFSHDTETAQASSYQVTLDRYDIQVRLSASARCGMFVLEFPADADAGVVIEPNSDESQGYVKLLPKKRQLIGYNPIHRIYQGWGEEAGFSGYFVAEFSEDFSGFGTYDASGSQPKGREAQDQKGLGAYVKFAPNTRRVLVKIGTSFTSLKQAEKNLKAELPHWEMAQVETELAQSWNELLNRAQVSGGAEGDQTIFYTALFHAFQHPRLMSDVDGSYPGFAGDGKVHRTDGWNYYGDFSAWDTYRAVHPLHNLLAPEYSEDFLRSLTAKAEQGGWMPIFPCWNSYTAAMIGDHLASLFADAQVKGIRIPEMETAYQYLHQNAYETPADLAVYRDGKGRRALDSYLQYGYIPMEDSVPDAFHKKEQVSRTLEYAYDDFALSQLATSLGKTEDAAELRKRALNYRKVFDPAVGYMRGRYADGSWYPGFDANGKLPYITEGTPKHYSWYVPQDVAGLMEIMGGEERFVAKLDTFFDLGEYWHGNEPCHQTYYLYNYAGQPWKTQALVRRIIREDYHAGPGGLSGNEDSGQMSAWLVFSAMGLYPVCPGTDEYALTTPLFSEVKLNLPGQKSFSINSRNHSESSLYVQQASLGGASFERSYLRHQEILGGGTLQLELGETPNESWGSGEAARGYSVSEN